GAGEFAKARLAYETAARMPSWNAAARLKLGELLSRQGDREQALQFLREARSDERAEEELLALERALGKKVDSPACAGCPLGAFADWDGGTHTDPALLRFLGADPERVIEIAAEYMRLGLYKPALDLLSRSFSPAAADETEPGALSPQRYPLVAYYRGYCRA